MLNSKYIDRKRVSKTYQSLQDTNRDAADFPIQPLLVAENHPVLHWLVAGSHTHCKSAVQSALRGESFLDGIWHEEEEEPGEIKGGSR